MTHQRLLVGFLVLLLQADLSALGQTTCGSNGNYRANLNTTLSSLSTNIGNDGFYNASTGQGPDRVNAIALCRGDVQLNACRECVQREGARLADLCTDQKQGIAWESNCMLRYSNTTVYRTLETAPAYVWVSTPNATSADRFRDALRGLLFDLRRQAAGGSSTRKVAAGYTTGPDYQTIFGLVQCTPDLTSEDCTTCLDGAVSVLPRCCDGRRGGRVFTPSCFVWFESTPFYNETRLQELEFVPPPPSPPPPPLPPSSPSGELNCLSYVVNSAS